ncbi:hypothetical protein L798_14928 [Zootermopsis nevadensis]|uniref:Uncharacterized protein n=1 Tax=Zootermopsis nevadensis TaxID=136037 RepID=A0A067QQB8_ZOONE|nr:hypothetical protein L798_14928 [Zootermopsis nevadensis]
METARTSETSINFYSSELRYNPEDFKPYSGQMDTSLAVTSTG